MKPCVCILSLFDFSNVRPVELRANHHSLLYFLEFQFIEHPPKYSYSISLSLFSLTLSIIEDGCSSALARSPSFVSRIRPSLIKSNRPWYNWALTILIKWGIWSPKSRTLLKILTLFSGSLWVQINPLGLWNTHSFESGFSEASLLLLISIQLLSSTSVLRWIKIPSTLTTPLSISLSACFHEHTPILLSRLDNRSEVLNSLIFAGLINASGPGGGDVSSLYFLSLHFSLYSASYCET